MEIKSEYYAPNASRPCGEIISASLEKVVDELIARAGFVMSASLNSDSDHKRMVSWVTEILKKRFRFLPLSRVVEAFDKGSLGELGMSKEPFSVRTFVGWIHYIEDKHRQSLIEDSRLVKKQIEREAMFPYGAAAVRLKFQWRRNNVFTSEEWDRYPIERIFELIKSGRKIGEIRPEEVRI